MSGWEMLEWAAWALSAVIAAWLLFDAFKTGRDYDESFLVHTMEDLGETFDDPPDTPPAGAGGTTTSTAPAGEQATREQAIRDRNGAGS